MSTLAVGAITILPTDVHFDAERMNVGLSDGRETSVPIDGFLAYAMLLSSREATSGSLAKASESTGRVSMKISQWKYYSAASYTEIHSS